MTQTVPVADSLPLIGSAWPMYDALPQFLHAQYRKHGPVFTVRAVGRQFLVLAGVDAVNFVGSPEGKKALGSKDAFQGMISEYGTDEALVNADGERHAQFRKMVHKGYSREALNGRYEKVIDVIDTWLNSHWTKGANIPAVTKLQELIIDELSVVFGDMLLFDDIDHIRTQIHWSTNVHLLKRWPKIALRLPKYQRAKARLIADAARITAIFEERAKSAPEGIAGTRLFDDLVAANKQYPDIMTRHDLPMNVFGPFLGGMDTASNTVAAILCELARHPEYMAKVESEADSLFSAGTPDEDALFATTPFLQAVVKESMRLYPSVPVLMRHARCDFDIAGHRIRQGQQIMVATCVAHMSDDYFADPTTFNPYRFIGPDRIDVPAGALAPFGRGHHLCMGKRVAEVLVPLTVARIVHQNEYRLVDAAYRLKNRFSYGVELAADLRLLAGSMRSA